MSRAGRAPLQLELQRVRRRLDPPQRNANAAWSERMSLELALGGGADDALGRGEAAPLPDYSPDNASHAEAALASVPPAELAELAEIGEPRALLSAVAALIPEDAPSARFALETALLDRAARRAGTPLWQSLAALVDAASPQSDAPVGRRAAPLNGAALAPPVARKPSGASVEPVAICALLPSADPAAALALALRHLSEGVTSFKLKVGPERLHPEQDLTFERLRAELGASLGLRADANGSLSRDALRPTLVRLASHGVEFLEEPLTGAEPELLADSPCPLALDESLQRIEPALLARWLALPALRVLVLKPTTLGGIDACLRLARAAGAHRVDTLVSHAFEGPIAWAACAHLALALGGKRAAGLAPLPHQAAPWPRIERGWLLPAAEPGLGGAE